MNSLAKNLFTLLSADIVRRILGFLSVAYLARVLGAENFGAVNVGFAVLSYGIMVSAMGLPALGAREIVRSRSSEIVSDILSLRLILSTIVVAIITAIVFVFVKDPGTGQLIVIFSFSTVAYAFLLEWYFQGIEDMRIIALGRVSSPALYVLLIIIFVQSPQQILWVATAAVSGDILFAVLLLSKYRRAGNRWMFRVRPDVWRSMLRESWPIALGSNLAQFTVSYPPIALALLMSNADVGIFSAASKLVFYLLMVDRVIAPLLLPALTRWQGISTDVLARRIGETLRWLMIVALPIAVGGTLLARAIVNIVFGPQYVDAADIFRVFVWYFFLTIMSSVYGTSLLALGQNKTYGLVMFASAMVYLVVVTFLTIRFGAIGTAFGIVLSEGITLITFHVSVKRFCTVAAPRSIWKIFLSSLVMALAVTLMSAVNLIAVVLLGALIYAVTVVGIRAVKTQEVADLLRRTS